MIINNDQYFKILKQISIKLKGNPHPIWIGTVLTDLELDEYKDHSREITQELEDRGFITTTNIHDGQKSIVKLSPAAFAFIQEHERRKTIAKQSGRSNQSLGDKIGSFMGKVCLAIVSAIIKLLLKSLF